MISNNYQEIKQAICEAALRYGRDPDGVKLVAVTKSTVWSEAEILYQAGQRDFAENRLAEAFIKQSEAPSDCQWHLIGTLQRNKVRKAIGKFALIHSVDSLELAEKIALCSEEAKTNTSILLQVNTSGELSKHGMTPETCLRNVHAFLALPNINIEGLMTMAPLDQDERVVRSCFSALRQLRDSLRKEVGLKESFPQLSMGMSQDFKWAIAEGATIVRIGTALFV